MGYKLTVRALCIKQIAAHNLHRQGVRIVGVDTFKHGYRKQLSTFRAINCHFLRNRHDFTPLF